MCLKIINYSFSLWAYFLYQVEPSCNKIGIEWLILPIGKIQTQAVENNIVCVSKLFKEHSFGVTE